MQQVRRRTVERGLSEEVRFWPSILARLQYREAEEPIDSIWATTAMLHEGLQKRFVPIVDYSELGRKEYWKTYTRF